MFQKRPDAKFLVLLCALLALGLVMLTSASGPLAFEKFNDPYWYIKHQLLNGLLPGIILFVIFAAIDYRHWLTWSSKFLYASVAALLLVFIPGLAADWGTSKSWIHVFGVSVQPVEAVKLLLLLYLAAFFSRRDDEAMRDRQMTLVPFVTSVGAVAVLLMLQPDLGSLLVVSSIALAAYFVAGASLLHLGGLLLAGAAGVLVLVKSAPYRAARLMTFMHPGLDPQGVGYHINQAFLAIGSGGWFGLGLGHSRQKYMYLPEVAGDSIFAVMAEELGFIFMLAVVALLVAFMLRMLKIGREAPDKFGKIVAIGIVAWVFSQTLFNAGSMVGIMPITGLPMPFISYGGTSLAVLMAAMGILANISSHAEPSATPSRRRDR